MHRTQVSLDKPLYEELRRRAFERRVSMALLVREALAEYLGLDPEVAPEHGEAPGAPGSETAQRSGINDEQETDALPS